MGTESKQLEVRTDEPARPESTPRLPHERDESDDSQSSGVRPDIKQAYQDVQSGQVDTDLREERGVDALVTPRPGTSPVNPSYVNDPNLDKNDGRDNGKEREVKK